MKTKLVPVAKKAIQELSEEELRILSKFSDSKEYELFRKLSEREKYLRYQNDFLTVDSVEQINFLRGVNVGIDYIIDSVNRAKEELEVLAKVDKGDQLK